ncbi:MAG: Recombination protein RecR [bacterium ADurb.Bin400]|nr:MAG: Recombination protein RecR [bacterium ADurb.Bin400]
MLPEPIQKLIDELSKLPGIGPKTAARLVFYMLSKPKEDIERLGLAVLGLKENLRFCSRCYNIAEHELCEICSNEKRNQEVIAVVEEPLDVIALEKTRSFDGLYHVLGGAISPIDGIGPEQLRIQQLLDRLHSENTKEVIMATDPDFEGEATAAYIKDKMRESGLDVRVTRIARGLPVGSNIEYADEVTIKRSLEGRRDY